MSVLATRIRYILCLLVTATFLHIFVCQAGSPANESSTDDSLWQPAEGTREEWMACHGMPKDVCERTKIKKQELQKILAKKFGLDHIANDASTDDSGVDECIMFGEEQLDVFISEAKNEENKTSTRRKKRTLIDFKKNSSYKWSMPVPYMFDGAHDDIEKATIRGAFQHWADNTCIRFEELETNARFNSNFILMTRYENYGCGSYVGRILEQTPQQINLAAVCIDVFGIILHEIGHSLGLHHEQSRIDSNNSVTIVWSNIQEGYWSQYEMVSYTDALGLPYNYGSVMHYPSKNLFAVSPDVDTMIALDPLYQMNMGQTVDLSFHDRKIINLAYCKDICAIPLSQPCQRGGYQNPNNCSICICPDGFSGQHCEEIARPRNANCGGILNIASGTQQVIKSPGYGTAAGYSEQQECTWWIKAPENHTLQLDFDEPFGIVCLAESACAFHWVEIKYKNDLGLEGARFCCYGRPNNTVISESNEMMIIFRSNYSSGPALKTDQLGFQAIVKTITPVSYQTSTPASNRRTSASVSTMISSSMYPRTTSMPSMSLRTNLMSSMSPRTTLMSSMFPRTTSMPSMSSRTTSMSTRTTSTLTSSGTSTATVSTSGILLLTTILQPVQLLLLKLPLSLQRV